MSLGSDRMDEDTWRNGSAQRGRPHTHARAHTHTQTTYDIPDTVISKTFKNLKRLK